MYIISFFMAQRRDVLLYFFAHAHVLAVWSDLAVNVHAYLVARLLLHFVLCFSDGYSQKNEEGLLVNALGMLLVLLGFIVVYLVTNDNYRRRDSNERIQ